MWSISKAWLKTSPQGDAYHNTTLALSMNMITIAETRLKAWQIKNLKNYDKTLVICMTLLIIAKLIHKLRYCLNTSFIIWLMTCSNTSLRNRLTTIHSRTSFRIKLQTCLKTSFRIKLMACLETRFRIKLRSCFSFKIR